jgi:hypothetical protein
MLNYTIGAVRKKKSTAKKKSVATKSKAKAKTSVKSKWDRFPSQPKFLKDYKVSATCTKAGKDWQSEGGTKAAGILALCRASAKNLQTTAAALKKYGVTKAKLSRTGKKK